MFSSIPSVASSTSSSASSSTPAQATSSARAAGARAQALTPSVRDGQFTLSKAFNQYAKTKAAAVAKGYAAVCEVRVFPGYIAPTFHGYKTGKEMDLTIPCPVKGLSLDLAIVNTLSGHDGQDKVEDYVNQAQYIIEIELQRKGSLSSQTIYRSKHGPTVANSPAYDDLVAKHSFSGKDLAMGALKKVSIDGLSSGDVIVVKGWPVGSGGVYGYVEGRQTRITLQ